MLIRILSGLNLSRILIGITEWISNHSIFLPFFFFFHKTIFRKLSWKCLNCLQNKVVHFSSVEKKRLFKEQNSVIERI